MKPLNILKLREKCRHLGHCCPKRHDAPSLDVFGWCIISLDRTNVALGAIKDKTFQLKKRDTSVPQMAKRPFFSQAMAVTWTNFLGFMVCSFRDCCFEMEAMKRCIIIVADT